jgi:hypothetical protein
MIQIHSKSRPVLLTILLSLAFACGPGVLSTTPTLEPVYTIDDLRFDRPETERRFRELDRCAGGMADETWNAKTAHVYGNLYELSWCRGAIADTGCGFADNNVDSRDQQIIELGTYFYDFPDVSGLRLHAVWVPPTTGWGASFFISEADRVTTYGEGWSVDFYLYSLPKGPPDAIVSLGDQLSHSVYQTTIFFSPPTPGREDLKLTLASPEAMRDRGLERLRALAEKVEASILAGQVENCDPGKYEGGGIPPACPPRPLTAEEKAESLAQARTFFATREQLLRDNYREMYAAWMAAFPLDRCWQK